MENITCSVSMSVDRKNKCENKNYFLQNITILFWLPLLNDSDYYSYAKKFQYLFCTKC